MLNCAVNNKFDNLCGEPCARLDRMQCIREPFVEHKPCYIKVASIILFNTDQDIVQSLNDVYMDDMVFTIYWRNFARKMETYWRDSRLTVSTASQVLAPNAESGFYLEAIALTAYVLPPQVLACY